MITILIAEDMKPMVRNLQTQIKKIEPRVTSIKAAYNGLDALNILNEEPIDILISDIRMPMMDGLQLIEAAVKAHPHLKSILLTGYKDFEYARKAIELHVSEYLLKPLEPEKLARILNQLIEEIMERKTEHDDDWLLQVLSQDGGFALPIHSALKADQYALFILRHRSAQSLPLPEMKRTIRQITQSLFAEQAIAVTKSSDNHDFLMLLPLQSDLDNHTVIVRIEQLFAELQQHPSHAQLHMIYSFVNDDMQLIKTHFHRLQEAVEHSFVLKRSQLLAISDIQTVNSVFQSIEREQFSLQFQSLLKQHEDQASFIAALQQLMRFDDYEPIRIFKQKLAVVEEVMTQWTKQPHDFAQAIDQMLYQADTYQQVWERFVAECMMPYYAQLSIKKRNVEEALHAIDSYLLSNIYNQVTLGLMAEKLNYSASYMIRIFKKHRGITPMDYFTTLKIDEAKTLITDNNHMLFKDISEALGFSDQHYFTKVFKQYTGMIPSEFKQSVVNTSKSQANIE